MPFANTDVWHIRPRYAQEAPAEADLIYNRARPGSMAWGQPIERSQIQGNFLADLGRLLNGQYYDRWVLPDPNQPGRLLGALWVEVSGWRSARLSLFLDPTLHDPSGRLALLQNVLGNRSFEDWTLRLEMATGDLLVEEILQTAGFHRIRDLTQMRRPL